MKSIEGVSSSFQEKPLQKWVSLDGEHPRHPSAVLHPSCFSAKPVQRTLHTPSCGATLSMGQVAAGVSLELSFHQQQISSIFPCQGAVVLRSKASPVTSPTSKAPGTSHQAQRSFLKKADEATPATRSYLHPALCTPTSTPCLFLTDLRHANTFYWNKTNAIKNLLPQKEQTKLQEKFCRIPLNSKFYRGSGDLQASLLPQAEVASPPWEPGRELGVLSVCPLLPGQWGAMVNSQPSKPAGLDVTPAQFQGQQRPVYTVQGEKRHSGRKANRGDVPCPYKRGCIPVLLRPKLGGT